MKEYPLNSTGVKVEPMKEAVMDIIKKLGDRQISADAEIFCLRACIRELAERIDKDSRSTWRAGSVGGWPNYEDDYGCGRKI